MLHLVLVEAALETVPMGILGHPSVRRNAKRRKKRADEILLTRSLHHHAMERLPENQRRGRPDIANVCLLEALGAPLNKQGNLRTWIHTYDGYAIEIAPETRLPRDCNRFNSLMEQLFADGRVPPGSEAPLMTLELMTLGELVEKIEPTHTVALTSHGRPDDLETVCGRLSTESNPAVFIGAFPYGPMKKDTLALADEVLSIHPEALEAWVITSRLVYEFEKALRQQ